MNLLSKRYNFTVLCSILTSTILISSNHETIAQEDTASRVGLWDKTIPAYNGPNHNERFNEECLKCESHLSNMEKKYKANNNEVVKLHHALVHKGEPSASKRDLMLRTAVESFKMISKLETVSCDISNLYGRLQNSQPKKDEYDQYLDRIKELRYGLENLIDFFTSYSLPSEQEEATLWFLNNESRLVRSAGEYRRSRAPGKTTNNSSVLSDVGVLKEDKTIVYLMLLSRTKKLIPNVRSERWELPAKFPKIDESDIRNFISLWREVDQSSS